ncbi:MAG: YfcE family phosphodiesterase [Clostridia bacterium]|nr:YfcE family phosphodiesterase [Clostridia bacterium]
MIRIGVMSDSHGFSKFVREAYENMRFCNVVVHLGDHIQDARDIESTHDRKVYKVSGNCDWLSQEQTEIIFEAEGIRVLITHGHKQNVKNGLTRLSLKAEAEGAKLALYGHTHIRREDTDGECVFVNPGALMEGKYAIVTIDQGKIHTDFCDLRQ